MWFLAGYFCERPRIRRRRRASKSDPSRPARRATKRVSGGRARGAKKQIWSPDMMKTNQEILIAGITPSFLEKGVLWFSENFEKIKIQAKTNSWWQDNTLFLETGQSVKISEVLRWLTDLGYERVSHLGAKGEFVYLGGSIDVFPINAAAPIKIDWLGNIIETITGINLSGAEKESATLARFKKLKIEERYKPGDYIVHLDHGIGIFREIKEEFFVVEYAAPRPGAAPDTLYIPFAKADKLSAYLGFATPQIHRLGSQLWFNTRKRIKEETIKLAQELIALYAKREVTQRQPVLGDETQEKHFAADFEYIETEDQTCALKEIASDLQKGRPMNRLVCGDVGFGKTEVAMRAAFKAVLSGLPVAILAPTTILCEQHFETFSKRFSRFPVMVARLSRLTPKQEQREVIKKINDGKIDIVIGTHRLLSKDLTDLFPQRGGLLIIDEEQRFGVKQKEKLKSLNPKIDILNLSATPIPRTLYLALSSLQDVSQIKTPPPGRLAIKTFVLPYSRKIIGDAIDFELKRSGQIYYLHNRIETIELVKKRLLEIKPNLKIGILHARLSEKQLIETMKRFHTGEIRMILATSIIENGLDFQNANTLIVDNAARLGLSQSHQIRGRIGRSNAQAYAYFLYQSRKLEDKAKKRLLALQEYQELGAGSDIALRDLEIRGAGNILGREQSGHISAIGLNLYCQMLSEAVENLKPKE